MIEQSAPGYIWRMNGGHTISTTHRTTLNSGEVVYNFESDGPFGNGDLLITEVTNEEGNKTITYTDKLGRVILSKREVGGNYAETYTIYDDFGRISTVISPEASQRLKTNGWSFTPTVKNLIYEYEYDERGRVISKKIPGAEEQIIVYDDLDRVVLTQDGNLRGDNKWLFTKYDVLSRPVMTGIYEHTNGNTPSIGSVSYESRSNGTHGYTNTAFPTATANTTVHSVTYYDDYDFDGDGTDDFSLIPKLSYTATDQATHLTGKLTGTKVLVLDDNNNKWLHTVTFYDNRSRVIQIQADNHLNGTDITTTTYDFTGKAIDTERDHTVTGHHLVIDNHFKYDRMGRLQETEHTIHRYDANGVKIHDNEPIILSHNTYNELNQLIEKSLHSTNGDNYLQNVDYKYNIRGWLTDINNINWGGLTPQEMAAQVANGLVDKIQDSDIEIELDVAALNAGSYEEIQVSEEAWYAYPSYGELSEEEEILELQTDNLLTATFANAIHLDYMGETIDETNFDQALGVLTTDLNTAMDSLGLTDQLGRELVEEEVMTYFRDIWLKTIANDDDDDLFAMHFDYTQSNTLLNANGNYNGNISQLTWRVRGRDKAAYGFQYDELDRIEQAKYAERDDIYVYHDIGNYNVENISYDFNGNIQTLDRKGNTNTVSNPVFGWIDKMDYTYFPDNPNQLKKVIDNALDNVGFIDDSGADDYGYDANGNLIGDKNKDITSITYNHQNLPTKVVLTNSREITWTYDAAGVKLRKYAESGAGVVVTHYVGGIEYHEPSANTYELSAVYHSEGRLTEEGQKSGRFDYEYSLKDHLGNSRVIFCDLDNNGVISLDPNEQEIIQENHYYPFGLSMVGDSTWYHQSGPENFYQYNGKELNADFGLNWHSYGFRMYDAALGRFPSIDPIADQFAFVSPYNYAENTPIMAVDLHGLQAVPFQDAVPWLTGEYYKMKGRVQSHSKRLYQGSTKSNPVINEQPISQSSKDKLHKAEALSGAIGITGEVIETERTIIDFTPLGVINTGTDAGLAYKEGNVVKGTFLMMLAPLDALPGKKSKILEEGGKTIYRAIGTTELKDIIEKRGLDFKYGGLEAKFFAERMDDAIEQGLRGLDSDNFLIISISLPKEAYDKLYKTIDNDVSFMKGLTVVISGQEQLNYINNVIEEIVVHGKK